MFSNKGKKKFTRTANVKGYLGGFRGMNEESDNDSNSQDATTSCSSPNSVMQPLTNVLVEIPEELESSIAESSTPPTTYSSQKIPKHESKDDSAAIAEIGNNLMDLDNYMMSVFYHNDDASVYSKATAETMYSCSNSSSSTISTRRRHRGAAKNRRKDSRVGSNKQQRGSSWVESMKKSSMNIFVDGEDGWTPGLGWKKQEKKEWDSKPDGEWNDPNPFFDSVSKERLEI